MKASHKPLISVIIPVYNERDALRPFDDDLRQALTSIPTISYEIIYCDDGSYDGSLAIIQDICDAHTDTRLVRLSRNFGKEIATTAGIQAAHGDAIIMQDADGQHPVDKIPEFIRKWQDGNRVVVGIRTANDHAGLIRRYGSKMFYRFFNKLSGVHLVSGSTDFRLIDTSVRRDFLSMTERNRITRGLIDWLGYERAYVHFRALPRLRGRASYSLKKLSRLAIDSIISHSTTPLYATAAMGAIILPISTLLGVFMLLNALAGDPAHLHATGTAYVMVLLLFLVGVLLVTQGISGLYLSHIHAETQNRPLYVIDEKASRRYDAE